MQNDRSVSGNMSQLRNTKLVLTWRHNAQRYKVAHPDPVGQLQHCSLSSSGAPSEQFLW